MHAFNRAEKIRRLNDCFRQSMIHGGMTMLTEGVRELDADALATLLQNVRSFDAFTSDNDPHGEHDFGSIEQAGVRYFWKIDYYDLALQYHSTDASNPDVTRRVMTIMRADEY
jgi:hypothetical protein